MHIRRGNGRSVNGYFPAFYKLLCIAAGYACLLGNKFIYAHLNSPSLLFSVVMGLFNVYIHYPVGHFQLVDGVIEKLLRFFHDDRIFQLQMTLISHGYLR